MPLSMLPQPIRQCAWCCRVVESSGQYGLVARRKIASATHGICPTCRDIMRAEIDARGLPERVAA